MTRPAGKMLAGSSDASWGHVSGGSVATRCFTYNHGCVHAAAQCIHSTQLSSNEAETWALASAEAAGIPIINLLTEWGKPPQGPTTMRVDNTITAQQAGEECNAKGSRHYMRRIAYAQGLEAEGVYKTEHVKDAHMASDFLGKWVPNTKYVDSRTHVLNLKAQVPMRGESDTPCAA